MGTVLTKIRRRLNALARTTFILAMVICTPVNAAFLMETMEGERVDLHDFLGGNQWTLVMLWTTDCIPCEEQKPMIEAFHSDHKNDAARVIGLALDGPTKRAEIDKLIDHHRPSYTNLLAFDDVFARQFAEETGESYSVTPTYILYKPDGSLFGVHVGKINRQALDAAVTQ